VTELWYLLHFAYHDTGMARTVYEEKLTHCLGTRYAKNSEDMFGRLEAKQADAIRNAERLLSQYPTPNPEQDNPSTTVHLLVIELTKHRRP
jgi:hypothetical protein